MGHDQPHVHGDSPTKWFRLDHRYIFWQRSNKMCRSSLPFPTQWETKGLVLPKDIPMPFSRWTDGKRRKITKTKQKSLKTTIHTRYFQESFTKEQRCISWWAMLLTSLSFANKLIANETSLLWHCVWNEAVAVSLCKSQHVQIAVVNNDDDSWQQTTTLLWILSTVHSNVKRWHRHQQIFFVLFFF